MELEARLRPQLEFTKAMGSVQGQGVRLYSTLRNAGQVAARNIMAHAAVTTVNEISDVVKEKGRIFEEGKKTNLQTIIPNGSVDYMYESDGSQNANLIIWFEYDFLSSKEQVIAWIYLQGGNDRLTVRWFTDQDIRDTESSLSRN
jgi:hypothetical protein